MIAIVLLTRCGYCEIETAGAAVKAGLRDERT